MAEMTILHIASPFAFSTPVAVSRSGKPAGDDGDGARQPTKQTEADPAGTHANTAREHGIVDARDTRSALIRAAELAPVTDGSNAVSVEAVLAAYQQDVPLTDGSDDPSS